MKLDIVRVRKAGLRRVVFWSAILLMVGSALFGLIWEIGFHRERGWSVQAMAAAAIGVGSLLIALLFSLLEFTRPTFHPESELFDWSDVDGLRALSRDDGLDRETREFVRSLADRVAVVLPGRPAQRSEQRPPRAWRPMRQD